MPNIKSAGKRMRNAEKSRQQNKGVRSVVRTARAALLEGEADCPATEAAYRAYCSVLDKAVKKGVMARNAATRRKTRAANRLRKAKVATAAPAEAAGA